MLFVTVLCIDSLINNRMACFGCAISYITTTFNHELLASNVKYCDANYRCAHLLLLQVIHLIDISDVT